MVHPIDLIPVDAEGFDALEPPVPDEASESAGAAGPHAARVFPLLVAGALLLGASSLLRHLGRVLQASAVDRLGSVDLSSWQWSAGEGAFAAHVLSVGAGAAVLTVAVLRAARLVDSLARPDVAASARLARARWLVVVVACVVAVAVTVAVAFPPSRVPSQVIVQDVQTGRLSVLDG